MLLPVVFWFGLKFFIGRRRANLMTIVVLIGVLFLGVGIMALIAYGASSSADILQLIAGRVWLSGDVYIYAYQRDALTMVRANYHVSFFSYMLHPLTSLIGIHGYNRRLGSMLASEVLRADVLVGPNPQLPVLLDYFFPEQIAVVILVATIVGFMVLAVRAEGMRLAGARSRYRALGGIAAAVFAPAAGFTGTSQVLISIIGIMAATGCTAYFELLLGPRPAPAPAFRAVPSSE